MSQNIKAFNEDAANIIAKAFLQYPLMLYAFEGFTEQQRAERIHNLFTHCVTAAQIYGGRLVLPHKQAALTWLEGKHFTLRLPEELYSGMWRIPFQCGLKPTLRLMRHDADAEGWIREHSSPRMGYIWNIGVLPEARGKGYSRELIEVCIYQMQALGYTECWLATEDPKNVIIYQKIGFTVMNRMIVQSSGLTAWAMKRMII